MKSRRRRRVSRFLVPPLTALLWLGLGAVQAPAPSATVDTCSGVGHGRLAGPDAWFTPTESPPARTLIDQLQSYSPNFPNPSTNIRTGAQVQPGFLIRGWLHFCLDLLTMQAPGGMGG
jgi:hypothetical protein